MGNQVEVRLLAPTRMQIGLPGGGTLTEDSLPTYRISIPVPGGSPVNIIAMRADDTSYNDATNTYTDSRVEDARNAGCMFHVITDETGNRITVLMTDEDWARYQSALADFARGASTSPNLFKPNAASAALGLFAPQVQAGSETPRAPTPFRPMTEAQMRNAGIGVGGMSSSYLDRDIDIAMYEARTPAARAALLNAGYAAVSTTDFDDRGNRISVERFVTPMDARILNEMGNP